MSGVDTAFNQLEQTFSVMLVPLVRNLARDHDVTTVSLEFQGLKLGQLEMRQVAH
jgi:hypothetical protein